MKKILVFILLFLRFIVGNAQTDLQEKPYVLIIPEGWTTEQFPIPIGFAPEIPYVGIEDIRFAPGWANPSSDEYWTYVFLWYIDGHHDVDEDIIERHLKSYYTGLIKVNSDNKQNKKMSSVKTLFTQQKASKIDLKTFSGTIEMDDYMNGKANRFHCLVHVKIYLDVNKTALLFELSPKPFNDIQWKKLNDIWNL
jgi:hypothetical protein